MTATTLDDVADRPDGPSADAAVTAGAGRAPARSDDRRGPGWPRVVAVVGIAALTVPLVVAAVVALTRTWLPPSDHALIQLRVRDVGGPHTPLLGAYSRLGWNHPGPLAFWLLALPYRLFGGDTKGLLVGVLALNTAAIAGCLVLARRRGGLVLTAIVAFALAAMTRGLGAAYLFHTWNPDMPVYPTAFLLLATWSVVEGDVRVLPAAIAASCFAWQLHLGYLPVTVALAGLAVAAGAYHLLRARQDLRRTGGDPSTGEPGRSRRVVDRPGLVLGATVGTGLLCIAPLLLEQARNRPGNLRLIFNSFRNPEEGVAGFGGALRVTAQYLSPVGTWISGDDLAHPFNGWARGASPAWLVLVAVLVAGAGLAAWRTRSLPALRFLAVTSAVSVLAFVAVARTTGDMYNYLYNWLRPVSAVLWVSAAWAVWSTLVRSPAAPLTRRPPVRAGAAVVGAVATLALSVSSLSNGVGLEFQENGASVGIQALTPGTLAAVAGHDRVNLRARGGWCAGELGNGLALQMVEHGTEVAVLPELGIAYGHHRVRDDVVPTVELWCGPVAKHAIGDLPLDPVATNSILTDGEEQKMIALQERFRRELRAAGRDDLVWTADTQAVVHLSRADVPGVHLDPEAIARFDDLMGRAQASAAVFFRADGPVTPP